MVVTSSLHWYQVVLFDGRPIGCGLRARVQATNPDAALRDVMRVRHIPYAAFASIWLLGDRGWVGAPVRRQNVRVRLPRVEGVQHG